MTNAFKELGIPADMIRALDEMEITKPTPIQKQVIPFLLGEGGDLVAQAQTGTGKTAAFGLPLLTKIDPQSRVIQGLVIAPTRELAKQIGFPGWVDVSVDKVEGVFKKAPDRDEFGSDINESLIVELYSR